MVDAIENEHLVMVKRDLNGWISNKVGWEGVFGVNAKNRNGERIVHFYVIAKPSFRSLLI